MTSRVDTPTDRKDNEELEENTKKVLWYKQSFILHIAAPWSHDEFNWCGFVYFVIFDAGIALNWQF